MQLIGLIMLMLITARPGDTVMKTKIKTGICCVGECVLKDFIEKISTKIHYWRYVIHCCKESVPSSN